MTKYLVSIEFRYSDAPKHEDDFTSHSDKITVGVYDNLDEACTNGNLLMETLEQKFKLHVFPNNILAEKERFTRDKLLISDLAYLKTPFNFYAKITALVYGNIDHTIDNVIECSKRYKEYMLSEDF